MAQEEGLWSSRRARGVENHGDLGSVDLRCGFSRGLRSGTLPGLAPRRGGMNGMADDRLPPQHPRDGVSDRVGLAVQHGVTTHLVQQLDAGRG